ncbi:MAG: circadian clock KaiB family protein [Gemmatimonadota bacterium]|nr:circadian clock KaiB family protein [Gemmatimonadota bacterium]
MSRIVFTLYIAGQTPRSLQAAANLTRLGQERLGGLYDLTVVDVADEPERAEAARILTTPTLVKEAPGHPRRVTGDLSDAERVFVALGLQSR